MFERFVGFVTNERAKRKEAEQFHEAEAFVAGKNWNQIDTLQETIETVDKLPLSKQAKQDLVAVALGGDGSEEKRLMAAAVVSADPQLMTYVEGVAKKAKEREFQPHDVKTKAEDMAFIRAHARALDAVRDDRAVIKSIGAPSNVTVPDQYKALLQKPGSPQSVNAVPTKNDGVKSLDDSIAPPVEKTIPQKPSVAAPKARAVDSSDRVDEKPVPRPPGTERTTGAIANQSPAPAQWKKGLSPLQADLLHQNQSAQTTAPARNDRTKTIERTGSSKSL
jgi:hypothetical protein